IENVTNGDEIRIARDLRSMRVHKHELHELHPNSTQEVTTDLMGYASVPLRTEISSRPLSFPKQFIKLNVKNEYFEHLSLGKMLKMTNIQSEHVQEQININIETAVLELISIISSLLSTCVMLFLGSFLLPSIGGWMNLWIISKFAGISKFTTTKLQSRRIKDMRTAVLGNTSFPSSAVFITVNFLLCR
ncbi:hypothetical protein L9F63_001240, partial [Diploptera punctata]